MKMIILSAVALSAIGTAKAQPPPGQNSPIELKRIPADGVPSPRDYPFDRLIRLTEQDARSKPSIGGSPAVADTAKSDPPLDPVVSKDVPLTPVAKTAVNLGQAWMNEKSPPAQGKDGRVLYTFGAGLPTVVCAPLRVCIVELEPGEQISSEPQIGDSIRWLVSPAVSGRGTQETAMLVIKPKQPGLDTTMLISTDRRAYYLRLISKQDDFVPRVAFAYPEEEVQRWKAHLKEQEEKRQTEREATQIGQVSSIESLYFDYQIKGGDANTRPVRVVDDGKKTYVQMTPNAAHREAPALVVVGSQGAEMVNYRVRADTYIVDRLFERGALILGAGKDAKKVEIIRGTYRGKVKGDPYAVLTQPGKEKR